MAEYEQQVLSFDDVEAATSHLDPEAKAIVFEGLKSQVAERETLARNESVEQAAIDFVESYDYWLSYGGYEQDEMVHAGYSVINAINNSGLDASDPTTHKSGILAACLLFENASWFDFYEDPNEDITGLGYSEEEIFEQFRALMAADTENHPINDPDLQTTEARKLFFDQHYTSRDKFEGSIYGQTLVPMFEDLRSHLEALGLEIPEVEK